MTSNLQRRRLGWREVLGLAFVLSCGGLLSVEVERSATAVVSQGTIVGALLSDLGLAEFAAMDITTASELENQGVEPGDLRHAHLLRFALSADAALSFLDEAEVFVEAPGLPRRRVAHIEATTQGACKAVRR